MSYDESTRLLQFGMWNGRKYDVGLMILLSLQRVGPSQAASAIPTATCLVSRRDNNEMAIGKYVCGNTTLSLRLDGGLVARRASSREKGIMIRRDLLAAHSR